MATIASLLERKTNVESNNLKHKLRDQLYKDIYKLYSESIFSDLYINVENNAIKSHRCILQTRVPTFYNTYCQHPDLINYVPVSKLRIFIREIYNEAEIRKKEEDILKCIDSFFVDNWSAGANSTGHEVVDSRQRLINALNAYRVNRHYFRSNSDNSVYYSLVDKSLVLSDYSDINEDISDMSACEELKQTTTVEEVHSSKQAESCIEEKTISKHDCLSLPSEPLNLAQSKHDSNANKKHKKVVKCFIDASALIDEEDVESRSRTASSESKVKHEPSIEQTPDSLDNEFNNNNNTNNNKNGDFIKNNQSHGRRIDDSADNTIADSCGRNQSTEVPEEFLTDISSSAKIISDECGSTKNELFSPSKPKLFVINLTNVAPHSEKCYDVSTPQTEMVPNQITDHVSPDTTGSGNVVRQCTFKHLELSQSEISSSTEANTPQMFARFKSHLIVKYECAKTNHTYSKTELENLKKFDDLLLNDTEFYFLKCNLEEIISSESPSKYEVAVHKFLIKQYEKKHGIEKTSSYAKSLMWDMLKQKSPATDVVDGMHTGDLLKKLLSPKTTDSRSVNRKFEPLRESVTNSKSCGFFIDLKDNVKPAPAPENKEKSLPPKQLFSMFIDLSNSTDSDSSNDLQNKFERRKKQYMSKIEKSRELRNSVTSLSDVDETKRLEKIVSSASNKVPDIVELGGNVIQRNRSGAPRSNELRRSWNVDKASSVVDDKTITRHKRSYSVSEHDPNLESVSTVNAINVNPEPSEEFPSIGNADSTNELTVNGESEISNSVSHSEKEIENKKLSNNLLSKACPKSPQNSEENTMKVKEKTFVKLSDLDKEPKSLTTTDTPWPSIRMTKSVTGAESNWLETKLLNGSINSRSLSRIFPDLSASVMSKTNSDMDDTTVSSISSMQSSSVVSTCESNLELSSSTNNADNHTLGQDLLRMFLDEISTDVVVEVAGRRIKAHKCILTSRCQYFAALLSGGWVESAGNVLSIHGFSYNVVHFALRYIYSGESVIPENINIVELATLADYLCLEGLKEIVSSTLKTKYCHFFHKPCNVCSVGVLECLPIAINYGLDDLHRKSLRWITKHYVRLWCTKAFASLPWELIDKCYNQHVVNMTVNNVFETVMNCDKLFSVIPQTRWAEPCFAVTKKLHDFCIKYLANHFIEFLKGDSFTSIACNRTWGIVIMDEKTQHVCSKMRTDHLCQSYTYVSGQYKLATATHENEELIELLSRVKNQIETTLVKIALQASQCSAWFQMDPELRSHIQTSAGLTFIPTEAKRKVDSSKPRQSLVASSGSRTVDLAQVKSAINRQHRQNNVRTSEPRETRQSGHQRQATAPPRSSSVRENGVQNKENKVYRNSSSSSKSPYRNKYVNVKSRYMDRKNDKNDKTASETTPSEMSEAERTSAGNKQPSKSLVSSVHLSPATRQSVRAVSLSKIPISVRNSSQKRNESDKDTTSGSDNGLRSSRQKTNGVENESTPSSARSQRKMTTSTQCKGGTNSRASQSTVMRKSYSGSSRGRNDEEKPSRSMTRSYTKTTQSASAKTRTLANGSRAKTSNENGNFKRGNTSKEKRGDSTAIKSKNSSPEMKCPSDPSSKNSFSEELVVIRKPDIPFRRDGTFCIDEPTILRKHTSSDHTDIV